MMTESLLPAQPLKKGVTILLSVPRIRYRCVIKVSVLIDLVLSLNCGHALNPDQIAAQVEGSVAYGLDSLLSESSVAQGRIVERNFDTYPIARISQMPKIESVITQTYDFWGGVGEPTICVVAPAIMNAIAAARGKPVRTLPLKHEGLRIV